MTRPARLDLRPERRIWPPDGRRAAELRQRSDTDYLRLLFAHHLLSDKLASTPQRQLLTAALHAAGWTLQAIAGVSGAAEDELQRWIADAPPREQLPAVAAPIASARGRRLTYRAEEAAALLGVNEETRVRLVLVSTGVSAGGVRLGES